MAASDPKQTAMMLWASMTGAHLVYAVIVVVVIGGPEVPAPTGLAEALAALGLINALASWPVRAWLRGRGQGREAYMASVLVPLALAESVSLFGLVLAFLEQRPLAMAPFVALGFLTSVGLMPGDAPAESGQ